jgi:hypothetical protein
MRITKTALLFLGALALPAFAQTTPSARDPATTPGIDKRQANQEKRIQQGVQSGQLTGKEAARLEKGQARVERTKERAKSDGVVTKQERARIQHQQSVQSRHIAREKHNARAATK